MSTLISDEYRALLMEHRATKNPIWGNGGERHVDAALAVIDRVGAKTVLDYGCGMGLLLEALAKRRPDLELTGYDPGIAERSADPEPVDCGVSTDVLEHIEPSKLEGVLAHIASLAPHWYINVHTLPAKAILPDGRNAHLIQQPRHWWQAKLREHFDSVTIVPGFHEHRPSFVCSRAV